MFDARPAEVGSSRTVIVAAALAIGLLTGFAGGYLASERQQSSATVEVPAYSYTEDVVTWPDAPGQVVPAPEGTTPVPDGIAPMPGVEPQSPDGTVPPPDQVHPAPERVAPTRPDLASVSRNVASTGTLFVLSRPSGASIYLDGRFAGTTPLSIAPVAAGRHRVQIALAGHRDWATTIAVDGGGAARVAASLER